ncbi:MULTISPECIES: hypothetical protein [Bacillus]|uniref:hypothetical protein n=1 Tax=Bacillus TaxID=1386 RepID=UPI0002F7198F|nr:MULTISPECIES: hypothetical protein [Bacillus]
MRVKQTEKLVEFGVLINRIAEYQSKVPRNIVRQLNKHIKWLNANQNDAIFGKLITANLRVAEQVELYVKARNAGDEMGATEAKKKSEELWHLTELLANHIHREMMRSGV